MQVETATGPIDTANLGFTYMHEHLIAATPGVYTSYPHLWEGDKIEREATERLRRVHEKGVGTIVDMSPADFHRDPLLARRVSAASGVNILETTGAYVHSTLYFNSQECDLIADLFVRDIEVGINGTDIKAAVIKGATGPEGVTPTNEKHLRAAARAHRRTGAPISTHTDMRTHRGLDQQRVFKDEGVDLGRVVIGHSGDAMDIPYLEQLIDSGSYIGLDRFGIDLMLPEEQRIELLVELCRRGYAERMVLSHDASAMVDFVSSAFRAQLHWNWDTLVDRILPEARKRGVREDQIRLMTVDNPRAIFEAQGPY